MAKQKEDQEISAFQENGEKKEGVTDRFVDKSQKVKWEVIPLSDDHKPDRAD